jgi:hypothetical protein
VLHEELARRIIDRLEARIEPEKIGRKVQGLTACNVVVRELLEDETLVILKIELIERVHDFVAHR